MICLLKIVSGSMLLRCATVHYPSTERSKYSNCIVNPSKLLWYRKQGIHFQHAPSSTLNSLIWSGTDAIINAHDSTQNLGQT